MSMELWASPDEEAYSTCYDYFCSSDDTPEDYLGLAYADDMQAAYGFLEYLANRLHPKIGGFVTHTDGGEQMVLFVKKVYWTSKPEIRNNWAEIIATPLEKLVEQANLKKDPTIRDQISDFWEGNGFAERVQSLISVDFKDLSQAIIDQPSDAIVDLIIEDQIGELLS